MRSRSSADKSIRCLAPLAAAVLLALLAGCASDPSSVEIINHAPIFTDLGLAGDRIHVGSGTSTSLDADAYDTDGDDLTYSWSGPGSFSQFNHQAGTATWNVPAAYGEQMVTCIVSDGEASDTLSATFTVGRSLTQSNYGDVAGAEVSWPTGGVGDPPSYVLVADVTIPAGLHLTVPAGCRVLCESGKMLEISGGLTVAGLPGQEVVFEANDQGSTATNHWQGIAFASSAEVVEIESAEIRNAATGLDVTSQEGAAGVLLSAASFLHCGKGVNAVAVAIAADATSFSTCSTGMRADDCELSLTSCSFTDNSGSGLEAYRCRGRIEEECFFTGNEGPAIVLSGGSYLEFHDNSFVESGYVFSVGGGYAGPGGPAIDARCNYWGEGVSQSSILAQIQYTAGSESAAVGFVPWQASSGESCGDTPPPALLSGIEVDGPGHLLWGDPDYADEVLLNMDQGFPPRLLRIQVDSSQESFLYHYDWSTPDAGILFVSGGNYGQVTWPAQADDLDGSAVYLMSTTPDSIRVAVTITDTWGQAVQADTTFVYTRR
ncbi:MAG: right-handed parallel beta-helix repeat-containing protein [Candidatus Krumholzibacteriota bacterium]|nr:right-handed parallel beta-helix repeat-containing protein [Candidatus Krumholzibacteriota bacterium]